MFKDIISIATTLVSGGQKTVVISVARKDLKAAINELQRKLVANKMSWRKGAEDGSYDIRIDSVFGGADCGIIKVTDANTINGLFCHSWLGEKLRPEVVIFEGESYFSQEARHGGGFIALNVD